ncbi:MAG: methyltransferase domain-containing protein [Proteobacteria bacterium]|nr:MAG: methyltransferase domain-containing protein [Pseudomonadota bacterium]
MVDENFEERIKRNNAYYDAFAPQVKIRSEDRDFNDAFGRFLAVLPNGKTVLDVGCGAGNHLAVFKSKGVKSIGVEPSPQMRVLASEFGNVIDGTFETLKAMQFDNVGGVWAASSLLHVPNDEISRVFNDIAHLLPSDGAFYFTVRLGEGSKWDRWDDAKGDISRFLQLFNEDELLAKLEGAQFRISSKWIEDSYWGRPSRWLSVIAQRA